jgi:Rrf2 family iron-sulfur cluster assembly transcriptional regulator
MKITATEEVGMRCMLQLALRPQQTVSITELAASEEVAVPFAAKVLLALRRAGLVLATRGRHGGYRLAGRPEEISVARVLAALGKPLFDTTYCRQHQGSHASTCVRLGNCSLRPVWAHLDRLLGSFFSQTTLADLATGERHANLHLQQRWGLTVPPVLASRSSTPGTGAEPHAVKL